MLVINDNPIKVHFVPNWRNQHQHPQDCRLLCLRRPQARQVPALVLQCEAPACGEIRRWWWWSWQWWPRPWTWWPLQWWPRPWLWRSSGCIQRLGIGGTLEVGLPQPEQHSCSHFQRTSGKQHLQAPTSNSTTFSFQNCQKLSIDNSDLGTVQPRATAGMINVDELRVVNSKVKKWDISGIMSLVNSKVAFSPFALCTQNYSS